MKTVRVPLLKTMCETCPFRDGSPYADLAPALTESALTEASRHCHSTGTNAIGGRTGKPSMLCRGARNAQLLMLYRLGFLASPTDEAWSEKCRELGIEQDQSRKAGKP